MEEPYLDWKEVIISHNDLVNYSSPIVILDAPNSNQFYDVVKIMMKTPFNSIAYDYSGNIDFEINGERIMRFQADTINSSIDTISIGNSMLCKDTCSPFIGLGEAMVMKLDDIPPTIGNSLVTIKVWYLLHQF